MSHNRSLSRIAIIVALSSAALLLPIVTHAKSVSYTNPTPMSFVGNASADEWNYTLSLTDVQYTVTYSATITNTATGASITDGSSVPVGTNLLLAFTPHQPTDISWFGAGGTTDSPYGEWVPGATTPGLSCSVNDYVGTITGAHTNPNNYASTGSFGVYVPFEVNPPVETITPGANLTCSAATIDGSGNVSRNCTVSGAGAITPVFSTADTYATLYDFYELGSVCSPYVGYTSSESYYAMVGAGGGIGVSGSSGSPDVPAQTISFSFTGTGGSSGSGSAPPVPTGVSTSCNAAGTAVTLSWTASPGATLYYPRMFSSPSAPSGCTGYGWQVYTDGETCYPNPDDFTGTTVANFPITPGASYSWWVSAANSSGASATVGNSGFRCDAPGAPVATLTDNGPVTSGSAATLSWSCSVNSATSASISPSVGSLSATSGVWSGTKSTGALTTPTTYTLTCSGPGGTTTDQDTVSIGSAPPQQSTTPPTVGLSASPTAIVSGGSSTLTYNSRFATACVIQDSVGSPPVSVIANTTTANPGTLAVSPTTTTTYYLTCTGAGGSTTSNGVTVTVSSGPTTSLTSSTVTTSPSSPTALLTYNSSNVSSCSISPSVGTVPADTLGTAPVTPTTSTTYTLTCTGPSGTSVSTVSIAVGTVGVTDSLTANPSTIGSGGTSILTYDSSQVMASTPYCALEYTSTGVFVAVPANTLGTLSVSPSATELYELTCDGPEPGYGDIADVAEATVYVSGTADLTAGSVTPTSTVPGDPITLTATVTNAGTGSSGSFPSIFEINNSSTVVQTASNATLNTGSSTPITVPYTFSTPGSYQVRACANTNSSWTNIVTESNYSNNCGPWTTVTVTAPPVSITASCSVSPTSVATNAPVTWKAAASGGTGTLTYTWSGTGVSGTGTSVSESYPSPGTYTGIVTVTDGSGDTSGAVTCSTNGGGQSGGGATVTVNSCTPSLSANPSTITTGQTSTLTWNEPSVCDPANSCTFSDGHTAGLSGNYVVTPPTPSSGNTDTYSVTCPSTIPAQTNQTVITLSVPSAIISASPNRITTGESTTVTWSSANTTACTITKNGAAFASGTSGSKTDNPSSQTIYAMSCTTGGAAVTAQTVVNTTPAFQEF